LRILQISSARSIGGGERHLIDLSSGLVERGHEVFVALRKGAPVRQQLTSIAPDHIFEVSLRHALDFGSALKLSKIIRENKIEIVHAHLARDYPLAALAMRHNRSSTCTHATRTVPTRQNPRPDFFKGFKNNCGFACGSTGFKQTTPVPEREDQDCSQRNRRRPN